MIELHPEQLQIRAEIRTGTKRDAAECAYHGQRSVDRRLDTLPRFGGNNERLEVRNVDTRQDAELLLRIIHQGKPVRSLGHP